MAQDLRLRYNLEPFIMEDVKSMHISYVFKYMCLIYNQLPASESKGKLNDHEGCYLNVVQLIRPS